MPAKERRPSDDAPKLRDMPGPRRAEGFIGPLFQKIFTWPYRWALRALYRAGLRPWELTLLSLATNVVTGWLLVRGDRFLPGVLLIVAGLLDIFDGGVARLRGEAGPAGAFLDSVLDRISDVVLFGALYWSLAGQGHELAAALALVSLVVSLLVSQIRAEAEAMGLRLTEGLMQRLERYVLLMIGLAAPGALLPVLIVLSALGTVTVLQRTDSVFRQLGRRRRRRVTRPSSAI
jgi:phosphatidylglycerophosphate synthase